MRTIDLGQKDEISFENPGAYELISMNLFGPPVRKRDGSYTSKQTSLFLMYTNFSVYEDLYSNFLTASITIQDANSLLTEFPIIGDEIIELKWRSMNTEVAIYLKFRVVKIGQIDRINDTTNSYTLELISPIAIKNEKQKISKSFAGISYKTHLIIEEICKRYLGLKDATSLEFIKMGDLFERKKKITEDYYILESESGHSEKYVAPYITPFEIINNLCKLSINDAGSLYFFFEDTNNFRFINIEENSRGRKNTNNIQKFICFPSDTLQRTEEDKKRRWNSVIDYSIKKRFDVIENMMGGMYSSEVTFLDLEKKEYFNKKYYYQDDGAKFNHTSDGFLLTSKYSDLIHDKNNEFPATVQSIVPVHFGDRQSQDYTIHKHESFQRRMSMKAQLEGIVLEIQVYGDSRGKVLVGNFVEFSLLVVDPKNEDEVIEDPYLSGKYMITRVHHFVTKDGNQYSMIVEMISDTVFKEYDMNDNSSDTESISIETKSEPLELENDQVEVSTSARSNIIIDANHVISRKRRNMKASVTITSEEKRNV